MGMLSASLGRNAGNGSLHDLKESLLNALSGDIPCDGDILAFLGNLVNLVNVYNTVLRTLHVIFRRLYQLEKDVFNILPYISRLGKSGCIRNGKGYIDNLGKRLRQICFSGTGGAYHDDIALLQLHVIQIPGRKYSFVMIIHGNGKNLFCFLLSDHIIVQKILYLNRL